MPLYLGAVLIYSLLALAVAIPMTALISGGITRFLGGFINVTFPAFSLPLKCLVIEIAIGILCRCLRRIYPVMKGTGITVREAMSDYGSGDAAGAGGRADGSSDTCSGSVASIAAFAAQHIPAAGAVWC